MKLSRNTKIMIAGLVLVYFIGGWLAWEHFVKFSWCQKASPPIYQGGQTIAIGFDGTGVDQAEAEQAKAIIRSVVSDLRGWRQAGYNFVFDSQPADVTFHIVTAGKLASLQQCSVQYSCRVGKDIYINSVRWQGGSPKLSIPLEEYRAMTINHELGHSLGFDNWQCYGHGAKAPVMQQQSLGLGGLAPNSWPTAAEIKSIIKPGQH